MTIVFIWKVSSGNMKIEKYMCIINTVREKLSFANKLRITKGGMALWDEELFRLQGNIV